MFARFKREWLQQGGRCAGAQLLLSATAVAPALAQSQKAYRPQIAAMMAEARTSMASVSQELAVARQQLVAIQPTMALRRIDLVDPVQSVLPVPPAAGSPDPDDSLFSAGREALNRNNFRDAARLFEQLRTDYPRSDFVPGAMYWEAFSRYRLPRSRSMSARPNWPPAPVTRTSSLGLIRFYSQSF